MALTYRDSGVDIDEGDRLVELIKPLARPTVRPEVLAGIGGFGGLFALDLEKYREPVLVSGTDGVGTKLKIAFQANRHDTIGIDLVAMNVNDIVVVGAESLFFLDYFATSRLSADQGALVVKGISEGCRQAGCTLSTRAVVRVRAFSDLRRRSALGRAPDRPAVRESANSNPDRAWLGNALGQGSWALDDIVRKGDEHARGHSESCLRYVQQTVPELRRHRLSRVQQDIPCLRHMLAGSRSSQREG